MTQATMNVANTPGASYRAAVNSSLQALIGQNSGATAPSELYPYMWWADTTAGILKQRNAANTAWIDVLDLATGEGIAIKTNGAASKPTPVDADELAIVDSAASNALKKLTWANLKATLKTYFDALYLPASSTAVPVRQTVLSGPVGASGFSSFGGSTGSTTVTASGTLKATAAAGGDANRTGSITNPSWTGLSTNGTMYLYLDIAADGAVTTGSTTIAPNYQWGGTYSTTNGQNTYNIQEATMKVGNGTVASQVYRVFVGEVTVAGGVVTAITWYALMGRYDSGLVATLPGASSAVSVNHNLGAKSDLIVIPYLECITTDNGYAVGDRLTNWCGANGTYDDSQPIWWNSKSCGFGTNSAVAFRAVPKGGGGGSTALTAANWKYGFTVNRGW